MSGNNGQSAVTEAERVAMLDRELNEQLAGFDGILLGERSAAAKNAGAGGIGNEQGDMAGSGEDGPMGDMPASAASMPPGGIDRDGNASGGGGMPNIPGNFPGGGQGESEAPMPTKPVPADIPTGDNDDVVARQLREAAMMEKDPILRRKLWNEYRKYTGLDIK